jgi:hypothetical protein
MNRIDRMKKEVSRKGAKGAQVAVSRQLSAISAGI